MARRSRDYKAEYAKLKARMRASGYRSEREYRAVRKELQLPRGVSPAPRRVQERIDPDIVERATQHSSRYARMRRESRRWSNNHSRVFNSRYRSSFTDPQVERYWRAYVEHPMPGSNKLKRKMEKLARLRAFLYPDFLSLQEWNENYRA